MSPNGNNFQTDLDEGLHSFVEGFWSLCFCLIKIKCVEVILECVFVCMQSDWCHYKVSSSNIKVCHVHEQAPLNYNLLGSVRFRDLSELDFEC